MLAEGERGTATPEELFKSHMKMVVAIAAKKYRHMPNYEDIVQVGMMALHVASTMYDPKEDVSFYSYAVHRVTHDMSNYVLNDTTVRAIKSKPQLKIYHNYPKYRQGGNSLTLEKIEEMSRDLNVSVEEIRATEQALKISYSHETEDHDIFDIPGNINDPETEMIMWDEYAISDKVIPELLDTVLTEREKNIIKGRFFDEEPKTLIELGKEHNVSTERARQIMVASLKKLQTGLKKKGYTPENIFA